MNNFLKLFIIPTIVASVFFIGVAPEDAFGQRGTRPSERAPTQVDSPTQRVPTQVDQPSGSSANEIQNPLGEGNDDLFAFIDTIINVVLRIGSVIAVLVVIYAGFLFVTAGGDEKKISTAKMTLLYAVIGIAILLGARALSTIIINTVTSVGEAAL